MDQLEEIIFQSILHGGNAKSSCLEAVRAAKNGNFKEAGEKLEEAETSINEAHHIQTFLIQEETRGRKVEMSLLLVHAQDHIMNAITSRDFAAEIIDIYKEIMNPGGGAQ